MGKIFIATLICLAFAAAGCDAFKNHYDSPPVTEEVTPNVGEVPEAGNGNNENVDVVDYTEDTTECEHNSAIQIALDTEDAVEENSGWTAENGDVEIEALSLGKFTTKVSILNDAGKFSFTIKQTGKEVFNACDVMFEGCEGECLAVKSLWTEVKSGSIEIYKFNSEEDNDKANAGKYNIAFGESNMGDHGKTLEGSYVTDILLFDAISE